MRLLCIFCFALVTFRIGYSGEQDAKAQTAPTHIDALLNLF